jgi:hypothetical protein
VVEQLKPDDLAWVSRPYRWVTFARKVLGRPDAVAVLRRREEVREELRQHLNLPGPAEPPRPPSDAVPKVLVVKLRPRKRWAYPRTDERLLQMTASSWFKYEVKDVADAFLEVFAAAVNVEIRKGKARRVDHEGRFVYLVGRIPLEAVHHIDWSPDPTNWLPRLYTDYRWAGPLREVALYEDRDGYLFELDGVEWKRPRRNYLRELREELRRKREVAQAQTPGV